jgi:nucleolar protein 56
LEDKDMARAQLGLAHSYSRAKVKFNVNKADNMIIQVRHLTHSLLAAALLVGRAAGS